jgi:hypothetical protein
MHTNTSTSSYQNSTAKNNHWHSSVSCTDRKLPPQQRGGLASNRSARTNQLAEELVERPATMKVRPPSSAC